MKHINKLIRTHKRLIFVALPLALAAHAACAQDQQPAQKPLLVQQSGARPNIFIMLSSANTMNEKDAIVGGVPMARNVAFGKALREIFANPDWRNKFRLGYGSSTGIKRNLTGTNMYGKLEDHDVEAYASEALLDGPKLFDDKVQKYVDAWLEVAYVYGKKDSYQLDYPQYYGIYHNPAVPEFHLRNFTHIDRLVGDDSSMTNMVHLIGSYIKNNPWQAYEGQDCRKSYAIIFADGGNRGYSPGTGYPWKGASSRNGPTFTGSPGGANMSLAYRPYEPYTAATYDYSNKQRYIPYPRKDYGLYQDSGGYQRMDEQPGDMTAYYYWHTDLAPNLGNNVPPRPTMGDPTFWQNLVTYTIAWQNARASLQKFTMADLATYQNKYMANDYSDLTGFKAMIPAWNSDVSNLSEAYFDGFVRAGFTGGGRGIITTTVEGVKSAFQTVINSILNAGGNDAGVAVSGGDGSFTDMSQNYKYEVEYQTVDNSGDIKAYYLTATGQTNTAKGNQGLYWSAKQGIPAADKRNIYTISGQSTPIRFLYSDLTADVKAALGEATTPVTENFIRYLRGQAGLSDAAGNLYRARSSPVASIVNAPPLYAGGRVDMAYYNRGRKGGPRDVGAVQGAQTYVDWVKNKRFFWKGSIFAAANSGYVHALSEAGSEMAAYLPRHVMPKLKAFSSQSYDFEYLTDGPLVDHDVFVKTGTDAQGKALGDWQQMVYGSGGRGGKFLYALRLPAGVKDQKDAVRTPGLKDYIWEINDQNIATSAANTGNVALGFVTSKGVAGQLRDIKDADGNVTTEGRWVTLFSSGHYGASSGKAGLVVVDAMTGDLIKTIALPVGNAQTNALSGLAVVRDYNKRITAAYAGDKQGNLWRFDLRGAPANWKISYGKPLFKTSSVPDSTGATLTRPIYAAPAWQAHPKGGNIVVFGTGILMSDADTQDGSEQAIFGIWDPTPTGGNDLSETDFAAWEAKNLVQQTLDLSEGAVMEGTNPEEPGRDFFKVSRNKVGWGASRGWFIRLQPKPYPYKRANGTLFDFPSLGERVIGDVINMGRSMVISSTVINRTGVGAVIDSCSSKTTTNPNFVYVINALTGQQARSFDTNGDGKLDNYAVSYVPTGGFTRGMDLMRTFKFDPAKMPYGILTPFINFETTDGSTPPEYKFTAMLEQLSGLSNEGTTSRLPPGSQCPAGDPDCVPCQPGELECLPPPCVRLDDIIGTAFGSSGKASVGAEGQTCAWGKTWRPILVPPI